MKELVIFIAGIVVTSIACALFTNNADYCTNNDSRNREYESYVESLKVYDKQAYDSVQHTERYQKYIRKHGEWFNNNNY